MLKTRHEPLRLLALALLLSLILTPIASAAGSTDTDPPPDEGRPPDVLSTGYTPAYGYAYTVQPGDDVWLIAVAHGITMEELVEANGLVEPYWIHPGDKLWVPAEPAEVKHPPPPQPDPEPEPEPAVPAAAEASPSPEASPAEPVPAPSYDLPASIADWPVAIVGMMNEKRAEHGLPALTWSPELAQAAQAHAQDLAQRGWGSHVGSDGARLRTRLARAGYQADWASENWANARNLQHAFDMWWFEGPNGPHRLNILGPAYREVGIGIAKGGWGYYFVADFGSR